MRTSMCAARLASGLLLLIAGVLPAVAAPRDRKKRGGPEGAVTAATQPSGSTQPGSTTQPGASTRPAGTTQPAGPAKPKAIPFSFNNAPMNVIAQFLSEQMGKPVIPSKEIERTQITLINPKPLPIDEAMYLLVTSLHENGVAIEERDSFVRLIPIAQVAQSQIRTIGPGVDLKSIKPANLIVRKIFALKHYDPTKLVDVLKPLLPSYGQMTAEAAASKLMVVATVERLMVMEEMIKELDGPDVSGGDIRVFQIKNVDVFEIVPLLEKLVAGYLGAESKAISAGGGGVGRPERGPDRGGGSMSMMQGMSPDMMAAMAQSGGGQPGGKGGGAPAGGAVIIKAEKTPVLLIPEPRQSSIIVSASSNVMTQIDKWIKQLDQAQPPNTNSEIVEVKYGDAGEVVGQLNTILSNYPDDSMRTALKVFPFASSRRIMVVGTEQNRKLVKKWLGEIDVSDAGQRVTQTFTLNNADAQQVADNLKELFQEQKQRSYWYYDSYSRGNTESERTKVTVTANMRSNSVTVVAAPEKMSRIKEQIDELDKPLEGDEAAPRIYNLKYADPDKTKTLLETLFTKKEEKFSWRSYYDEGPQITPSPVGRLFGQFRFEAYPDTGKLIVVSKNEENYAVIDKMIAEIDQPQTAGLPRIIQLKFADAETLAEQLNALLNAPGTPASILRRRQTGTLFTELPPIEDPNNNQQPGNQGGRQPPNQPGQGQGNGLIQFWWQNPPSDTIKVRQPSNLVGKMRIVPNVEQNLLMVAAPEEYKETIETFIHDLDKPGQQVLIKAVIAAITHDDTTSLGYRFSSDPSLFTSGDPIITENALRGLLNYQYKDTFGNTQTLSLNVDVNNLISLLHKVTNLKIKSEPRVFTADNVEGEFFDGQDIPFINQSTTNSVGSPTQSFAYRAVGLRLRVRPHITKERDIDLTVNLQISNTVPGQTLLGGAIINRRETTTRIVLQDGKTFLISGILREEDSSIIRRIPGLGDIPGIGEIFKHRELVKVNSELLIFLTPYVITAQGPHDAIESEPLQRMEGQFGSAGAEEFGPLQHAKN